MTFAVIRIRSPMSKSRKIEDTLNSLRLDKVNHCTILPQNKITKGMLTRVKDVVTWGEIDESTLKSMLLDSSNLKEELTDEYLSKNTEYESMDTFVEGIIEDDTSLEDVPGLENRFRLHPPRGGFRGVKKPYRTGGSLGYRGKDINNLIGKMLDGDTDD